MTQHTVKVIFDDGDFFYTRINADEERIRRYYAIGRPIGFDSDKKIAAVEIIH